MEADCIGREGLVDNVREGFGHLINIFSFARGDEMLSMLDIGRGKLLLLYHDYYLKIH